MSKGILFILSGPSGSGKTTLAKHVVEKRNDIEFAISYTTRLKRDNETDGIDYRFVSIVEFKKMINNGDFAEWAEVYGNMYGTPITEIKSSLNSQVDILLDIDVQGAKQIKEKFNNSVHIFLVPPNMKILKKRLNNRQTEDDINLNKRLDTALKEISHVDNYDFIIINQDVKESIAKLESIIEAVRLRTKNMKSIVFGKFNL